MQIVGGELPHMMVGFGSDGASVMMGHISGVQARLKVIVPRLIEIHCVAHRGNLVGGSLEDDDTFNLTSEIISDTYNYYHANTKRLSTLKDTAASLNLVLKAIIKPCPTRWFYDKRCLDNLLHNMPIILYHLHACVEAGDNSATALYNKLVDVRTQISLMAAKPMLDILSGTCIYLQNRDITMGDVGERMRSTRSQVATAYKHNIFKHSDNLPVKSFAPWDSFHAQKRLKPGCLLQEGVDADLACPIMVATIKDVEIPLRYTSMKNPTSVPVTAEPKHMKKLTKHLKASLAVVADKVVDDIRARFPSTNLMLALSIIDINTYKKEKKLTAGTLSVFLRTLQQRFCAPGPDSAQSRTVVFTTRDGRPAPSLLDRDKLDAQFPMFKSAIYAAAEMAKTTSELWGATWMICGASSCLSGAG